MMQDEVKEHLKNMKRSGSKTSDSGSKNSDQEYFRKSDHDDHNRHQSLEGKASLSTTTVDPGPSTTPSLDQ